MNLSQLNNYFDSVFSSQSASQTNYGKFSASSGEIVFESSFSGGIYTLSCTVGGTRRVKASGTNAPAEIPWNSAKLSAYFVTKMDALFNALSVSQQALFAVEYVAVKDFIARGKLDVAKHVVTNTAVSDELQKTKDAILAYLS